MTRNDAPQGGAARLQQDVTSSLRLSKPLKALLLSQFTADQLAHMAASRELVHPVSVVGATSIRRLLRNLPTC